MRNLAQLHRRAQARKKHAPVVPELTKDTHQKHLLLIPVAGGKSAAFKYLDNKIEFKQ